MFICVDTHYFAAEAVVAGVGFEDIESSVVKNEYVLKISKAEKYLPGFFYKRELPGILELLHIVDCPIHTIIIDGYVWLSSTRKPGLGSHLYSALGMKIPIIGVAKNPYKDISMAVKVFRGKSKKPLYITAAGIETNQAAHLIEKMHGKNRLPTFLKYVDALSRRTS